MIELPALAQFLSNGLYAGSAYLLLALGITLVYGVMRVGDLAQGGVFAVGAFVAYALSEMMGVPYGVSLLMALGVGAGLSTLLGHGIYRRLQAFGIGPTFIGAVALLIALQSLLAVAFGEGAKTVASPFGEVNLQLGPIGLFPHKLFAIGVGLGLALGLWRGLRATRWGQAVRALSQNREAAALSGVNVGWISLLTFAVAGGLAGLAGAVTAPVGPITPFVGRLAVIKAFAISRVGRGSVPAVLSLALMLGISESLTAAYVAAEFSDLIPLGILILIMLARTETLGPEEHLTTQSRRPIRSASSAGWPQQAIAIGALVVGLTLPLVLGLPSYVFHLLIFAGVLAICVMSSDLLYGFTGLPSLAQGAFWGVGAYTSALLMLQLEAGPVVALLGALSTTLLLGAIVGALGVRAGRHWTLFTFMVTVLFTLLVISLDGLTGGPRGLSGVPMLPIKNPFGLDFTLNPFQNKPSYYVLVALVLLVVMAAKAGLTRSWFGRALVAIREDEGLARSVGVPVTRYKVVAFSLSALTAGGAGFLYAHYAIYLHPDLFNFISSFNILMLNMVGGLATSLGPLLAPLMFTLVDELTRPINAYIAEIVFGALLLIIIMYLPGGLTSGFNRLFARWTPRRWRRSSGMAEPNSDSSGVEEVRS